MADAVTGNIALERAEHEMLATHEIKPYPEPTEGLTQGGSGIGQYAHLFVFVGNVGEKVLQELLITSFLTEGRV